MAAPHGHGPPHRPDRMDGTLLLANERVFATPAAAASFLSSQQHHGWSAWRRTTDGRTLAELRTDLLALRGW